LVGGTTSMQQLKVHLVEDLLELQKRKYDIKYRLDPLVHENVHGATHERNRTKDDMTDVILVSYISCPSC
ncbi:hypothetical protein Tco_1565033, partial [Tanacetum coccineum]